MNGDDSGSVSPPELEVDALQAVFDTLSDAVLISDTDGRILDANHAARERYGHGECVGSTLDVLGAQLSTDDRTLVDRLYRAAEVDDGTVEWEVRTNDGDLLHEELQPTHTTVNGESRLIVVARKLGTTGGKRDSERAVDITDEQRRETELTRLRERFEQFADNVQDAFFLVSADYTETLYVNDAVERIYGITPAEAYADPESWLRHVPRRYGRSDGRT